MVRIRAAEKALLVTSRKTFKDFFRAYIGPAGIGALAGILATLATAVPQFVTKTREVLAQQEQLRQVEQEMAAYSAMVRKMRGLLPEDALGDLFEDKATVLIHVDSGNRDRDTEISAALKRSSEGAYFVWCTTGYNTSHGGADLGFWMTHGEALAWASRYATADEFTKTFGEESRKFVDKRMRVARCG
jgi:hypothetical protein